MKLFKLLMFITCFSGFVSANSGYLKINNSQANKDWSFLPEIPSSFDTSSQTNYEFLFVKREFGLLVARSEFELNVARASEPKKVTLSAEKNKYEVFYFLSPQSALSLAIKDQVSDRQFIDCYSFGSMVIGTCDSSDLIISNSNAQYSDLNGSILLIDGRNESIALNYNFALDAPVADEIAIGLEQTKNQYFWITPLEGITSSFILNLNVGGSSLGSAIDGILKSLPQRTSWTTNQINVTIKKEFKLAYDPFSFFYEISALYIDHGDYESATSLPNSNFKLTSGIKLKYDAFDFAIYGNFFQNNLLGFEPIAVNQRTENYFTQNFGSLGFEIKYNF
ncbi:hypothetical protein N9O55_01300 [Gammaproteobacteria bacterium]|nr:hypothetical protein [Gammaproteobacteria bacterium]MDA9835036.1 hypothetical protein [Gammaproteobacteria bacterium]